MDTLNIIHLPNNPIFPHRQMREENFMKEIKEQGIEDYKVWDGIYMPETPITGIALAHKQIVRYAADSGLERVIIAEDDFAFTDKGAWKYFLKSIPESYDMFMGHVYDGKWDEEGKIKGEFTALTLYCVHSKFYSTFLNRPNDEHLDWSMNKAWRYDIRVCLPMVCRQINGWTDNEKKIADWTHKEQGKPLFKKNKK